MYHFSILFLHAFKGKTDVSSDLTGEKFIGFYSITVQARTVKLCSLITLSEVCWVILGLMSMTCFKASDVSKT